jgi:hypothetical protein
MNRLVADQEDFLRPLLQSSGAGAHLRWYLTQLAAAAKALAAARAALSGGPSAPSARAEPSGGRPLGGRFRGYGRLRSSSDATSEAASAAGSDAGSDTNSVVSGISGASTGGSISRLGSGFSR